MRGFLIAIALVAVMLSFAPEAEAGNGRLRSRLVRGQPVRNGLRIMAAPFRAFGRGVGRAFGGRCHCGPDCDC